MMKSFKQFLTEQADSLLDGLEANGGKLKKVIHDYIVMNEQPSKADVKALVELGAKHESESLPIGDKMYRGCKIQLHELAKDGIDYRREKNKFYCEFDWSGYGTMEAWTSDPNIADQYASLGYGSAPRGESEQPPIKCVKILENPKLDQGWFANEIVTGTFKPNDNLNDYESLRATGTPVKVELEINPSEMERIINERNLNKAREALGDDNPDKALKFMSKAQRKFKKGGL